MVIRRLFVVLLILWAGSLWSLSWVTWILFHAQSDRHLAGVLAGSFFSVETGLGLGSALLAALLPGRSRFLWGYAAAGVLAANEWALRPAMGAARAHRSFAGLTFGAWHGVSALLYLAACIAVVLQVWKQDFK